MKNNHYTMKAALLGDAPADKKQAALFERSMKEFFMVPNMFRAMGHQPALLEMYMNSYAAFRAESGFTPQEQEVVLLTISVENKCVYCVTGHSMAADVMSNVPTDVTDAIRNQTAIGDAKLNQLSAFTKKMLDTRGMPAPADAEAFLAAGYTERHMLSIVMAIALKTLSNYTNHLFNTQPDEMAMHRLWSPN